MAFRRRLTTNARLFAKQRFTGPSISFVHLLHEDRNTQHLDERWKSFPQSRSFGNTTNTSSILLGFGVNSRWSHRAPSAIGGFSLARRNMSSSQPPPVISEEVAAAAADSCLPVAACQYAIDAVHNFTGLNWWADIVITTIFIRTLLIPIMINQLKNNTKLIILRPQLEEIQWVMQDRGLSSSAVAEGREKIKTVYKQHGVSMYTSLIGLCIQGPVFVSFLLAIQNMVEKVPSFKTGGASWFLDLTTVDPFYLLPCLSAFTFWVVVEFNMQEGMEGNSSTGTKKNILRAFAALSVPITATFPKAVLCYWITSNLFSLVYGLIIKIPRVKKMLNITYE